MRPVADRVLVRPREDVDRVGSLYVPDATRARVEGTVVAVGDGRTLPSGRVVQPEVVVGDRVLYSRHGPAECWVDGEKLLLVREDDIVARWSDERDRWEPIRDRLLVRRAPERQTPGGIIIPEQANRSREAVVVAAGPGRRLASGERVPMPCAAGDRVVMRDHYSGFAVSDAHDWLMVEADAVWGVVEG